MPGREPVVPCLVRVGSSFTGGAGAAGSSVASMPSGPNGSIEASRVSRVVDCVRLPYRRGPRDFEGAGLMPLVDVAAAGDEGASAGFGDVGSDAMISVCLSIHCLVSLASYLMDAHLLPLQPWLRWVVIGMKGHLHIISP